MIRFEDLLGKVRAYSPDADLELLRRAYVFSAFEHRGQVRRSGEPYLIHPLAVAEFLVDLKLDVVAISAGLLHDVVGGAAGGELPQDAARDGRRHPRDSGEARGPRAQHAHAQSPARGTPSARGAGDTRYLRADCQ